jgi:hypothetical protein
MNFNLISPLNNGSDYVVQFRENIEIKSSSKVYLNFCELTRQNNIILSQDGEITIKSNNIYPKYILEGEEWINNLVTINLVIKKGTYTIDEFLTYVYEVIKANEELTSSFFYYTIILGDTNSTTNSIPFGYYLSNEDVTEKWIDVDLELDVTNNKDFIYEETNKVYTSDTADYEVGIYNSYGLAQTHYYHYLHNDPDQNKNEKNWIRVQTTNNLQDNICFGLYSTEYMDLDTITQPITKAGNLVTFPKPAYYNPSQNIPMGFLIIELQMTSTNPIQDEPYLKIWVSGISNSINEGDIRNNITTMDLVHEVPLSLFFDSTTSMKLKLRTYNKSIQKSDFDSGIFYFELWTDDINNTLIYDSIEDDIYFDKSFFEIPVTPAFTANSNECTIPFKVILAGCKPNDGFSSVTYKEFKKGPIEDGTSQPNIIQKYFFEFSDNLRPYFGTTQTDYLYPNNTAENPTNNDELYFFNTEIAPDFLNDSYTISLDELPLNSYKNIEDSNSGGYSQNIISNVPMPFLNSISSYQTQKDLTVIKGLYEPNVSVVNKMKNKDIRTNKFSVKIRNMKDDKIATELISSTINFTITD